MANRKFAVSSFILVVTLLAGCTSSGFKSGGYQSGTSWAQCTAKGGVALGIPALALDIATGGVAFLGGALISGVACAVADNGAAMVQFDFDSSKLSSEQKKFLDYVSENLKSDMTVEVTGHTCDIGTESYNKNLSVERANAVRDYLVMKGVPKSHIKTIGRGEALPKVPNTSEKNRGINRRAEIRIEKS